ncbi:MAG TPA: ABC transporter ATP-binding protein [Jatrophihabitans sp.]|jgi:ABC-2 type transport system ATP-binding protein|uniref:ATP-binding cassette domain-containing protein n=1 Tax=Jatrophihabitans sp. TaxID=1932789 RepID=UPI002F037F83
MPVVEIREAHKTYRRWRKPAEHAVRGLNLDVEAGGVFGFLGPNGSGKTTTIRLLLGLVRADSGSMRMLGQPVPAQLPQVIGRIGALVETPLFFPQFTGRRNLDLLAQASAIAPRRVDELLDFVGLTARAGDRVKGYSLGMKQRLGIAAALLKNPELLILDEPGNGLDAAGIREVRELIVELGASGVTVLLSSHQLGEVQQVCDRVAIMSHGQVISTGSVADLLASQTTGDVRVRLADPAAGRAVLERAGFTVTSLADAWRVSGVDDPAAVTKALSDAGHYLQELSPIAADLESVFLELTAESTHPAAGTPPVAEAPPVAGARS